MVCRWLTSEGGSRTVFVVDTEILVTLLLVIYCLTEPWARIILTGFPSFTDKSRIQPNTVR